MKNGEFVYEKKNSQIMCSYHKFHQMTDTSLRYWHYKKEYIEKRSIKQTNSNTIYNVSTTKKEMEKS